jgi:hypothetical protein
VAYNKFSPHPMGLAQLLGAVPPGGLRAGGGSLASLLASGLDMGGGVGQGPFPGPPSSTDGRQLGDIALPLNAPSQQPPWSEPFDLLAPENAFPVAGALISGPDNATAIGNAFTIGGDLYGKSKSRKKALSDLASINPTMARLAAVGAPLDKLWETTLTNPRGKAPNVETFYDANGAAYKAQWDPSVGDWVRVGGSKGDEGFEVSLPDGTTVRQGSFGNQDRKNVANRVNDAQDISAAASDLKQSVDLLRKANKNTGYSGVGGGVYGAVDDTLEQFGAGDWLPGNARGRATMTAGGLDVALSKVQKTKGAISNAEMGLFMAAAPGLQQTPEGNEALLDMMDAIADRQIMRGQEMERWRQQYGTLDGFEAEWGNWISLNPLIVQDGQGGARLSPAASGGASVGVPAGGPVPAGTAFNGMKWRIVPGGQ